MKKSFVFLLVLSGLTSCSKDSLDQSLDSFVKPSKSEIFINVASIRWTESTGNGCNHSTNGATTIADAKITLYNGDMNDSALADEPIITTSTDQSGTALLKNIEPSTYTVLVETSLGQKSRSITTQLHKRSYIDFSF